MEFEEINYREFAKQKLTDYLKEKGYRKTHERFAILDEIYKRNGHFDVESLHKFLNEKNYRVSNATLYNTLDLLLDCGLVIKHQFGDSIAKYEKIFSATQYDHLICTNCGKIIEFDNSEIQTLIKYETKKASFKVFHHTLYVYGLCNDCKVSTQKDNSLI